MTSWTQVNDGGGCRGKKFEKKEVDWFVFVGKKKKMVACLLFILEVVNASVVEFLSLNHLEIL